MPTVAARHGQEGLDVEVVRHVSMISLSSVRQSSHIWVVVCGSDIMGFRYCLRVYLLRQSDPFADQLLNEFDCQLIHVPAVPLSSPALVARSRRPLSSPAIRLPCAGRIPSCTMVNSRIYVAPSPKVRKRISSYSRL